MDGRRRLLSLAAFGLVAAWAPSLSTAQSRSSPDADGVVTIDIRHVAVEIAPFADPAALTGAQTIEFDAGTGGRRLRFPGGPLGVATLSLDGRPLTHGRATDGALDIALERTLEAGSSHVLRLTYRAAPGRGFHRSEDLAYSTYFACDWMLCSQADFSDRFTLDLTIRTPRGMKTLGPGTEIGVSARDAATEQHLWRTTDAYPAYVHGFVAGRLESVDVSGDCATRLDVLTVAPVAHVDAIFGPTCAMLTYFQARAGVSYPADRYSQLYLPDAWEAQEAISHSTLGGGAVQAMLTDPTEDWAVAHELAHQWWGNRITAADLSAFWLNEGIVTFMTATWKEHRWGAQAYAREIEIARSRWTRCRDEGRDAPLAFAGDYPSLAARRCVQYSKGAVFLAELRQAMGDPAFWTGLQKFTTTHLGRPVRSDDFEAAMQTATPTDLKPLFAEWVYTAS